jgi:hypothetical protein
MIAITGANNGTLGGKFTHSETLQPPAVGVGGYNSAPQQSFHPGETQPPQGEIGAYPANAYAAHGYRPSLDMPTQPQQREWRGSFAEPYQPEQLPPQGFRPSLDAGAQPLPPSPQPYPHQQFQHVLAQRTAAAELTSEPLQPSPPQGHFRPSLDGGAQPPQPTVADVAAYQLLQPTASGGVAGWNVIRAALKPTVSGGSELTLSARRYKRQSVRGSGSAGPFRIYRSNTPGRVCLFLTGRHEPGEAIAKFRAACSCVSILWLWLSRLPPPTERMHHADTQRRGGAVCAAYVVQPK